MPQLTLGAGVEYRDQVFVNTTARNICQPIPFTMLWLNMMLIRM